MIITRTKRSQADVILALIEQRIDNSNDSEWRLDTYNNCREQGYVLQLQHVDNDFIVSHDLKTWIAFSEYRNSDENVVYTDNGLWNGHLTDKSYDEKTFFEYSDFIETAEFIIKIMQLATEKVREQRTKDK